MNTFQVGDRVHFTDVDGGVSSGNGRIASIQYTPIDDDTIIGVAKDDGGYTEALPHELKKILPN